MCELAVEHTSTWLMVDSWEAGQSEYQRTAVVLDHFDEMLNGKDGEGGVEMSEEGGGGRRKYKIMLLAGGDLIESFGEPGVWSEPDVCENKGTKAGKQLICPSASERSSMSSWVVLVVSSWNELGRMSGHSSYRTIYCIIIGEWWGRCDECTHGSDRVFGDFRKNVIVIKVRRVGDPSSVLNADRGLPFA
jgi:hypothetical protein